MSDEGINLPSTHDVDDPGDKVPTKPERPPATGVDGVDIVDEDGRSLMGRLAYLSADIAGGAAEGAVRIVSATAGASLRIGRAMLRPERLEMMAETGRYIRDVRELAGLTLMELSEAIDMEDKSFLEAVEAGTATLSFELSLRIAALVARHDPVPFVMHLTRTYNPSIWGILHDWGVGRVSLQFEREREFINILRRHDSARKLSDEGYQRVLDYTQAAFEQALFYAVVNEGIEDRIIGPDTENSDEK